MNISYKTARRIAAMVIGFTILLMGLVLLVLPGPGIVLSAVGLAILGVEFAWARKWLHKLRRGISGAARHQRLQQRQR
jgi:tellurite resistance protein TerC